MGLWYPQNHPWVPQQIPVQRYVAPELSQNKDGGFDKGILILEGDFVSIECQHCLQLLCISFR